uniref:Uncharacterized protein n=1 Tax=Sus scrofa TaxID=9823 RepID=A0A8D1N886_PIG
MTVIMQQTKPKDRDNMLMRMGKKETLVPCGWGCKLVLPLWKTIGHSLKKLKIALPYDPAVPLLGIYLKRIKSVFQKDCCSPMLTAALLTISQERKAPLMSKDG